MRTSPGRSLAVGETVILLHPPLPLVGVSIGKNRGCQQNDSLADGYRSLVTRLTSERVGAIVLAGSD